MDIAAKKLRKELRNKLLEDNLCAICGKKRDNEKILCESCLIYKRNWNKQKRTERFNNGLCTYCGKNPFRPNKRTCQDYYNKLSPKSIIKNRKYNLRNLLSKKHRKQRVMDYYGGRCACCGESGLSFLTIDHIAENGAEHRKQIAPNHQGKGLSGDLFYRWLEKNNYPDGFQTLCYNCNIGKHRNGGICPHQQSKSRNQQDG